MKGRGGQGVHERVGRAQPQIPFRGSHRQPQPVRVEEEAVGGPVASVSGVPDHGVPDRGRVHPVGSFGDLRKGSGGVVTQSVVGCRS